MAQLPSVPGHLPHRLALTLWDFSWYTRAGAGDPFDELDRAFSEATERGYNAVRICAAPLYLFGNLGLPDNLAISGLGPSPRHGRYGQRTRWYDAAGGYSVNLWKRLLALFAAAKRHGIVVILSSWEYQQSPAFAKSADWWRAIDAIPLADRYRALADAFERMLGSLAEHGYLDAVAFVELHNEVDFSRLPDSVLAEAQLDRLRMSHPTVLATLSFAVPPERVPRGVDLVQAHVYTYGVVDELQRLVELRDEDSPEFPNAMLRDLLREDAPTLAEYGRPEAWRLDATVITSQMIYGYDWMDTAAWDHWLFDNLAAHRAVMEAATRDRVDEVLRLATSRSIPAVIGEGWIGYTPLEGQFEDSPVGLALAELGIRRAVGAGAWGMVTTSNAAPHHPMWKQHVAWQKKMTSLIRNS